MGLKISFKGAPKKTLKWAQMGLQKSFKGAFKETLKGGSNVAPNELQRSSQRDFKGAQMSFQEAFKETPNAILKGKGSSNGT